MNPRTIKTAQSFDWSNPRSRNLSDLDPQRRRISIELVARLPISSHWSRSGVVERQTVSTEMQWQPRLMVLTSTDIFFSKPDSDAILDKLPLQNIAFIGKVNTAKNALGEPTASSANPIISMPSAHRANKRMTQKRSALSGSFRKEHLGDLQVGAHWLIKLHSRGMSRLPWESVCIPLTLPGKIGPAPPNTLPGSPP